MCIIYDCGIGIRIRVLSCIPPCVYRFGSVLKDVSSSWSVGSPFPFSPVILTDGRCYPLPLPNENVEILNGPPTIPHIAAVGCTHSGTI